MASPNPVIIVSALQEELRIFTQHIQVTKTTTHWNIPVHEGEYNGIPVVMTLSGVGKVNAAGTTQWLISTYNPRLLVFSGVAGSLNPSLNIGDIVIGERLMQHDLSAESLGFPRGKVPYSDLHVLRSTPAMVEVASGTQLADTQVRRGLILTGDEFIHGGNRDRYTYLEALKGDAIEMEGAAFAQICTLNEKPFLVVRALSDNADGDAPENFVAFVDRVAEKNWHIIEDVLKSPTLADL